MKVYVLTREENAYGQDGQYYCGVFANKPSREEVEIAFSFHGMEEKDYQTLITTGLFNLNWKFGGTYFRMLEEEI